MDNRLTVETAAGPLTFYFHQNGPEPEVAVSSESVTFNGVEHNLSVWLYRTADGAWQMGSYDKRDGACRYTGTWNLSRRDMFHKGRYDTTPSSSAHTKARKLVDETFAYVLAHNPGILNAGRAHTLTRERADLRREHEAAVARLRAIDERVVAIDNELDTIAP